MEKEFDGMLIREVSHPKGIEIVCVNGDIKGGPFFENELNRLLGLIVDDKSDIREYEREELISQIGSGLVILIIDDCPELVSIIRNNAEGIAKFVGIINE